MAASDDREDVALSSSELDDVLSSAGLAESSPGLPADNLELYGVWVKVKPQPVATRPTAPAELADLESAEAGESAELTDDEQDLLAELESSTPATGAEAASVELGSEADLTLPDMPSLGQEDNLSISDEPVPGALDDLSLEEPGGPNLDREVAALDAELGPMTEEPVHTVSGLPSLEEEEVRLEAPETTGGAPTLDLEDELVLEEPAGISLDTDIDLEAATESAEREPAAEKVSLPALDEDIILEEPPAATRAGVAELEAADAFEPETPLGPGEDTGIDLEAEIAPRARAAATPRAEAGRPDAASLILTKIEEELHAIRREISDLKGELTVLRKERDELVETDKREEEKAGGGFFGGEEDETIALTGDELDNILSTADVTEAPQVPAEGVDVEMGSVDLEMGPEAEAAPDILAEDILERPEADLDLTVEADSTSAGELSLSEEELVDSSADDGIKDESSLLSGESLEVDLGEGPIVETEEEGVSVDLAADLAAEAEAAVAETRGGDAAAPPAEEFVLEEPTVDLDLGAEAGEPAASELDIDLDLEAEPASGAVSAPGEDMELVLDQEEAPEPPPARGKAAAAPAEPGAQPVPDDLRDEIKSVLAYLDQLLEALPDEKIEEFAKSEYFGVYKKLFVELGLED